MQLSKTYFKAATSYCMICMVISFELLKLRIVVSFLIINLVKIILVMACLFSNMIYVGLIFILFKFDMS